jgi:hypothetical protein
VGGLAAAIAVLLMAGVAQAVPASTPEDTAMVDGTSVRAIAQAGNLIWVGGDFDTVKDGNGNTIRSVSDLAAFKADASGALATGVNLPAVTKTGGSATIYDLSLLGNTLYLAGTFDKVDGQARSNVAAIDATTGALLPFNTNAGPANAVFATPTAIYVGTGKLLSFQPNGANTPGYTALKTYIDATIRAHNTTPQVRDIKLQGSTLVAACQCDSITDINNTTAPGRLVKAVVEVNATTGALTSWTPSNLPSSSGAFGISLLVHDFPGTSTPTVYLAAGGSDFTAAYDFATGAQRFKTDTSGSSQAVAWYQGALVIGGHFNWSDSPASNSGCGDNANPNTTCYHSPKLVSMDASNGKVILGSNNLPWNPGICCAYNGVWVLTTGDDGSTLHVGGEFTKVGGAWSGSGNSWTLNAADTQRYYARLGGPAVSIQTLTLTKAGTGTGTVTSNPAGINCGTGCAAEPHDFSVGQGVTLTAVPDAGSVFTGWTGGGCSGNGTCSVTMTQAQNVSADFDVPTDALTVTQAGGGAGTVTSSPSGVNCGTTCSATFNGGTVVTLMAAPSGNDLFQGWSGACSGTASCTITMDAAKAVTATFGAGSKLTIASAGTGSGTVSSSPAGITCPATCVANFSTGSTAIVTAAPAAGSTFTGFTGGCVSTTTTCNVSMTGNKSVTATFAAAQTLTVTPAGTGTGSVTSAPAGISCGATCTASFANGTSVTLTATPAAGATFTGWAGDCTGTTTTCGLLMDQAYAATATFTAAPQVVTLDDADLAVAYNGWRGVADPSANGGAYRVSNVTNDTLTWKSATTTSFAWITRKGPDRGIANVNIDGVDTGNVDLYTDTAQAATITYSGLTNKVHTVILTITGTKNAASSGTDVVIDAFTVGAGTAQESDAGVTLGTWKGVANASAAGGSYRWASAATASVTVTFTGTAIDWITTKGGNFGKVAITIDGVSQGTVDLYAAAQQWQSPVSYSGLAPGIHTIVIQVLDQKNAASSSTKIFVDGFTVHA